MKRRLLGGTALLIAAFSLTEARAQTCTVPPTCESLGYDRTEGECSDAVKSLRCPLDKSKVFCLTAAEIEEIVGGDPGNKIAAIGDLVYTDRISATPLAGRVPVGIVYDTSGKMLSLVEYDYAIYPTDASKIKCSEYTVDGITGWTQASMEDMGLIKQYADKINATIQKLGNEVSALKTSPVMQGDIAKENQNCYLATNGQACMLSGQSITYSWDSSKITLPTNNDVVGCHYCQKGNGYASRYRCVRRFGPNGANDVVSTPTPTPSSLGTDYRDSYGNIIGKIIAQNGDHGTIAYNVNEVYGSKGDKTSAETFCSSLTAGGLTWTLPSFQQMVSICQLNITGYFYGSEYAISDGVSYTQFYKKYSTSDSSTTQACDALGNNGAITYYNHVFCVANY